MSRTVTYVLFVSVTAAFLTFISHAAELKEASLVAKADAIAVVKEQSVVNLESGLLLTLSLEGTLKGAIPAGAIVTAIVSLPKRKTSWVRQPTSDRLLVFFEQSNLGYKILAARSESPEGYGFKLPSGWDLDTVVPTSLSVEDRVLKLVTESVEYTQGRSVEAMSAVDLLKESGSPMASESVQRLQVSQNSCVTAVAVAVGLAKSETEALRELANNFAAYSLCPAVHAGQQYLPRFYSLDPEAIRYLGLLATDHVAGELQGIGMSATEALERLHTKEAVPYLIKLLDDKRDYLRPLAVNGLSAYVQRLPAVKSDQIIGQNFPIKHSSERFNSRL